MPRTAPATGRTWWSAPMSDPTPLRRPPAWLVVAALFAAAINLRVIMAGLPPLVDQIRADLGLSSAAIGALTSLPVLCMGLAAPAAAALGHRIGAERAVLVSLGLLVLGSAGRGLGRHVWLLYAATIVAGLGIAVAGTLLPRLVKSLLPAGREGAGTGLYFLSMMVGATAAAGLAVPLADLLGSWEASLGSWTVLAVIGTAVWAALTVRLPAHAHDAATAGGSPTALPWRHRTAWLLAAYLVVQSWQFYASLAWLAPTYHLAGWGSAEAGLLLTVFTVGQLIGGLAAPVLADRADDRRGLLLGAAVLTLVGFAGLWLAPAAAPWAWALVLGVGQGGAFGLGLTLLVTFAATPAASGRLTALCFLLSYSAAAAGPWVYGLVRDVTGGYTQVWASLTLLMAAQFLVVSRLGPRRQRVP